MRKNQQLYDRHGREIDMKNVDVEDDDKSRGTRNEQEHSRVHNEEKLEGSGKARENLGRFDFY